MNGRMWALVHRSCGHLGGLGNDRDETEGMLHVLHGAGYFQWRIRVVEADQVEQAIATMRSAERAGCTTCRVDPLRGLLPDALKAAETVRSVFGQLPAVRT